MSQRPRLKMVYMSQNSRCSLPSCLTANEFILSSVALQLLRFEIDRPARVSWRLQFNEMH